MNDHADELRIDHTPYDSPVQGNIALHENPLKLYDNFVYTDPVNFFTRGDDAFVSVDQVTIDMPLKLLSKNIIVPEDAIDRMLAANLRIQGIMEKYEQLRKQALVLLDAGSRNTGSGAGRAGQTDQTGPTGRARDGADGSLPVGDRLDIKAEKQKLGHILQGITLSSDLPGQGAGKDTIIVSQTYPAGGQARGDLSRSIAASPGDTEPSPESTRSFETDLSRRAKVSLNQPDASLPWIFDRLLKSGKFVLEYRIEIITYLMFVLLVGFFISLRVKK